MRPNHITLFLGTCLLVATMASSRGHAAPVQLAAPDQPLATIVISESIEVTTLTPAQVRRLTAEEREARSRTEVLAAAVEDLVHHLETMTGRKPAVVITENVGEVRAPAIVLGTLAHQLGATPTDETIMLEAFRLKTHEGMVLIGGESHFGVSHGVYELLRLLGCDWIFPGPEGEIIPRQQTVVVPETDLAKKPAFQMRSPWYSGGARIVTAEEQQLFEQWKWRQQQTHGRRRDAHPYFLQGGHFWHTLLREHRKHLEENPDLRALVRMPDGTFQRNWAQLDAAHPGVVEMTADYIRAMFKRNGWPNDHAASISIGPNDGGGYSVSAESLAAGSGRVDPVTGDLDQTDILILYTNAVLKKLENEFPNLYLGWYLYSVHADYPMRYTPHPKLVINVADITYSRYHSTLDPRSTTRTYFHNILEQWKKLHETQGNWMWFYGYNWNLAENLMPYSKMKIWGQDLPYYHSIGIRGHNNEQDKAWSILGPHNYLMARLGWDMDLDWREVLKHYCSLAFGKGGPHMEAYYLALIEAQETAGHEAGSYHAIHLILDADFVARSRALSAAAAATADTDYHKKMVEYFSQPITALDLYLQYRNAVNSFDFVEGKRLFDAMVTHFDDYLAKNSNLVSRYGRRYMDWLFKPFVEQGLKYTTGEYELVYRIPDELPTVLDPSAQGQFMGFYRPEVQDHSRMKTRTYSTTWDAQGLGPYRPGAIWYRIPFDLPEKHRGQGIGLFIGSVEDEVHVWCNGEYLGSGRSFIKPFAFDLTAVAKPGEQNLIALQVIRRNLLNELNIGGLLYPSFIFAGPQLEQVAPQVGRLERILPGGAREDAPE